MISLSLISTIFGMITGLIPSLLRYLEKRQQYKYEIEIARLQIEATSKNIETSKLIEELRAITDQTRAIYEHDSAINDGTVLGFLRGSVRPVTTYIFLLLFLTAKFGIAYAMWDAGLPWERISLILMDEFTYSVFGAIIGFWFGKTTSDYVVSKR